MEGFGPHQTPTLEENQFYKDRMTTNDRAGGGGGGIGINISLNHLDLEIYI